MSARNKILFFIILINVLFLPVISKAVYNLSPFYAKVSQLVYSFIGDVPSGTTGFMMNGVFYSNGQDGEIDPGGLAIDFVGDRMYVLDKFPSVRVQRFVFSTGVFDGAIGHSTVANGTCVIGAQMGWCTGGSFDTGSGNGEFDGATDIKIDVANNLMYVSEGHRISKFQLSSGAYISSIGSSFGPSGTCVSGAQPTWCSGGTLFQADNFDGAFTYASAISIDPANDFLYVVDDPRESVQKFILSTGAFVGAIGKSSASGTCLNGSQTSWCTGGNFVVGSADGAFQEPSGIDIDPVGDYMYITDDLNRRIQRFILSTGAFAGAIGKSTASGTCIAGKQTSWCTGGVFSSGTGDGAFRGMAGVTIDVAHDRLYETDYDQYRVQQFVLSTGAFIGVVGNSTVTAGTCVAGAQTGWCSGGTFDYGFYDGEFSDISIMVIDPTNNILYVGAGNSLYRFNAATGAFIGAMGATSVLTSNWSQKPSGPMTTSRNFGGFARDQSFAVDSVNDRIYSIKYNSVEKAVLSTGAYIGSIGNSIKTAGTCVAGAQASWCVGGEFTYNVRGDGKFVYATGIAIDVANDRMYIASGDSYNVQKFVLSTGAFLGAIGNSTASGTCVAGKQTGWCIGGVFSSATGDGQFSSAKKVRIDVAADRMYILSAYQARIQKFVLSTGAFVGAIGNSTASGTCIAGAQTSWCTGGVFSDGIADGQFSSILDFNIDPASDSLIVSQYDDSRVQKFILSTGAVVGSIGSSTASGTCIAGAQAGWCTGGNFTFDFMDGKFDTPSVVGIDSTNGFLFIADDGFMIQKFKISTGAYVGTIGGSTLSGNCLAGKQKEWCVGGNFYIGKSNGFFNYISDIVTDPVKHRFFVTDQTRLHKISY